MNSSGKSCSRRMRKVGGSAVADTEPEPDAVVSVAKKTLSSNVCDADDKN
jgi:hypothetical protein